MTRENTEVARPERARGFDKLALTHGQHLRAHQSRIADPSADGKREHQVEQAGPEKGNKGDGQQDAGQCQKSVHHKDVQHGVEYAAVKTGEAAEDEAERQRAAHDRNRDQQRDARAVNDA